VINIHRGKILLQYKEGRKEGREEGRKGGWKQGRMEGRKRESERKTMLYVHFHYYFVSKLGKRRKYTGSSFSKAA